MSGVETFGEAFPDLILEVIAHPSSSGKVHLHTWNGRRATTASSVRRHSAVYIPRIPASALAKLVRLPPASKGFGSMQSLVSSVRDTFLNYAYLDQQQCDLLVSFVFASWFCDLMEVSPELRIHGPESSVSQVLRILGCCCRHPALIGDVDVNGLATLPAGLHPTLLFDQRELGVRLKRLLASSNRRHFHVFSGKRALDLHGAKAYPGISPAAEDHAVDVSLSPSLTAIPSFSDRDEQSIGNTLQAKLLRYRMLNYSKVRDLIVNCGDLVPEMRDQARAWLAPIEGFDQLRSVVHGYLLRQSREIEQSAYSDLTCLVLESALFFCHCKDTQAFFVGDIAEKVNVLLKGRHEELTVSTRSIGAVLREIGIYGKRVAKGYKVALTGSTREQIHRLARDHRVLSVRNDSFGRCKECSGESRPEPIQ
jgi:hypothetical protein